MAKGLGKGEEYEDQNPISFAQCLTITGFVFPCVIYLVGVIYFFTTNYEYLAVLEYNDKVSIWNSIYSSFENLTFSYDTAKYQADYSMPGENWPVRDNCFYMSKKNSDCIQTKGLSYTIDLPIEQYHPSYVYYNNEVLYQNDYPYVKTELLNPQALHCSLEVENDCEEQCLRKHGQWIEDMNSCQIETYLSNLCIRVNSMNDTLVLDRIEENGTTTFGCYYRSQFFPAYYTTNKTSSITLEIRHHFDPVLVADNITRGCSTSTLTTSQCFNNIANHNSDNYNGLIALGSVLLVIFMIVYCTCIFVCKSKFSNTTTTEVSRYPTHRDEKEVKQQLLSDPQEQSAEINTV